MRSTTKIVVIACVATNERSTNRSARYVHAFTYITVTLFSSAQLFDEAIASSRQLKGEGLKYARLWELIIEPWAVNFPPGID